MKYSKFKLKNGESRSNFETISTIYSKCSICRATYNIMSGLLLDDEGYEIVLIGYTIYL